MRPPGIEEIMNGIHEVVGSIPIGSTKSTRGRRLSPPAP